MRPLPLLPALLLACFMGCDAVTVNKPFGEVVNAELRDGLRGTWAGPEGDVLHIETAQDGKLIVGVTEWDAAQEKFETKNTPMALRRVGERLLLFFPAAENRNDRYVFIWVSHLDSKSINVRVPIPKVFRQSVEDGQIDGEVIQAEGRKNYEVQLKPSAVLLQRLAAPEGDKYFSEKGDQPLRRLGEPDGQ